VLVFVLLAAGTIRSLRPRVDEAWYGTRVRERLREYQVVYDRAFYEVLARRSAARE
jgi:hypothetical protein